MFLFLSAGDTRGQPCAKCLGPGGPHPSHAQWDQDQPGAHHPPRQWIRRYGFGHGICSVAEPVYFVPAPAPVQK